MDSFKLILALRLRKSSKSVMLSPVVYFVFIWSWNMQCGGRPLGKNISSWFMAIEAKVGGQGTCSYFLILECWWFYYDLFYSITLWRWNLQMMEMILFVGKNVLELWIDKYLSNWWYDWEFLAVYSMFQIFGLLPV